MVVSCSPECDFLKNSLNLRFSNKGKFILMGFLHLGKGNNISLKAHCKSLRDRVLTLVEYPYSRIIRGFLWPPFIPDLALADGEVPLKNKCRNVLFSRTESSQKSPRCSQDWDMQLNQHTLDSIQHCSALYSILVDLP